MGTISSSFSLVPRNNHRPSQFSVYRKFYSKLTPYLIIKCESLSGDDTLAATFLLVSSNVKITYVRMSATPTFTFECT